MAREAPARTATRTKAATPTRIAADITEAARSVAAAEHRSITEQVNYWARIGMQAERAASAGGRQLLAVVRGEAQFSTLTPEERATAHAMIDAQIAAGLADDRFDLAAAEAGQASTSVDDDGALIQTLPDGTRRGL